MKTTHSIIRTPFNHPVVIVPSFYHSTLPLWNPVSETRRTLICTLFPFIHPFLLTTESLPAVLFQIPSPTQFSPSPTLFIDNVSANGSENGTDVLAICSDDAESHVRFIELLSHPRRRTPRPFEQMPKMQMKSVLKSSQMEMLSKKMSALPKYAKMNRSEVRRFHSPLISSCSEFRLRR